MIFPPWIFLKTPIAQKCPSPVLNKLYLQAAIKFLFLISYGDGPKPAENHFRALLLIFFLSEWSRILKRPWWFPAVTLIQCCRMRLSFFLFWFSLSSDLFYFSFLSSNFWSISRQSRGVRLVVGEIWSAPASPFFPLRLRDCTICCQWWTLLPRWIYFTVYFSLRFWFPWVLFFSQRIFTVSLLCFSL